MKAAHFFIKPWQILSPAYRRERNLHSRRAYSAAGKAFTLVELLTVMGIMAIMAALVVPAFVGLKGANDITASAYNIADSLGQARAYAMANATYVYVGITEVDASVGTSVSPQITTSSNPYGRIALAMVASRDGRRGYNVSSSLANPAWTSYADGAGLMAIRTLQHFDGLHLAAQFTTIPNSGSVIRPSISDAPLAAGGTSYIIGSSSCQSVTPFNWPLGSALGAGSGQYYFSKVINFDPQGVARIQDSVNASAIVPYLEIGLQQTHGTVVSNGPNVVAIQIDGMTGATRVYRP